MTTGSGIDAQLGYRLETTVGTEVTVNKWLEFNSENIAFDPSWIEPTGIRTGQKFKNASRLQQSLKKVSGPFDVNYAFRSMGGLWKASIGSTVTTPTLITGTSYKQVHQSGDLLGKSITLQVGRPEPHGSQVVRAHTFRGCKVTGWEFSCSADANSAKMAYEVDGWDEATATALTAASFVSDATNGEFNFKDLTAFSLGGTIGGTTELTYTGGTTIVTNVTSMSIKGDNALDTERYGLGGLGLKKEQLEAGIPTITVTFDAEYNQGEFYTPFKAGTSTSFLARFEGPVISEANKNTLEFIFPVMKIKKVTPQVAGPGIVKASVEAEVYSNNTNNPAQVLLISADSVAI